MKKLKKHPKQQRMEDMTFPIFKTVNAHSVLPLMDEIPGTKAVTGAKTRFHHRKQKKGDVIEMAFGGGKPEKVIWTGREYLRSINDDNGFTLMPRIVWRVVAVGVLVGAVIYFLSKAL